MWFQYVWMRTNDYLHTKGHEMFPDTKLVWKWSGEKFLTPVDEYDYDVDFGLWE